MTAGESLSIPPSLRGARFGATPFTHRPPSPLPLSRRRATRAWPVVGPSALPFWQRDCALCRPYSPSGDGGPHPGAAASPFRDGASPPCPGLPPADLAGAPTPATVRPRRQVSVADWLTVDGGARTVVGQAVGHRTRSFAENRSSSCRP